MLTPKMELLIKKRVLQGGDTVSGLFLTNRFLEFVVKVLDKYSHKDFLKIPS